MAPKIIGQLRDDDTDLAGFDLVEPKTSGKHHGGTARFPHGSGLGNTHGKRFILQVHLAMVTRVPSPGLETISNSSETRLAPPSPSPRPPPVVKPFCIACSISGMPGPLSSKVARNPFPVVISTASNNITPPLP